LVFVYDGGDDNDDDNNNNLAIECETFTHDLDTIKPSQCFYIFKINKSET